MIRIEKIQTFDNVLHNNYKDAEKHLQKLYSDKLCSLSHKLLKNTKYIEMTQFIDENLHEFGELQHIKNDLNVIDREE